MGGGGSTHYHAPPPPPPDKTFENYLKYQSKKAERGEYRDWLGEVQDYKSKKGRQKAGRMGWQDFKSGVKEQLGSGLLTYNEARSQLSDYADRYNLASGTVTAPGTDPRDTWQYDRPDELTPLPTFETPPEFQDWSVSKAQNELQKYYSGTGEIDAVTGQKDRGIRGQRQDTGIRAAYQELLGRDATADEFSQAQTRFGSGYYTGVSDLKDSLTKSGEYTDKFQQSYLDNYYDTMFGDELRDQEGKRSGRRQFHFPSNLLPEYSGDLKDKTKITTPEYGDSFVGTPGEIDFQLDNIRETRKFLYSAGLTNLQGEIDKETQKLKNEGAKDVTKIKAQGDIYGNLVNAFNF